MDLSGIIFVALAIGWAVYLIPKALQREDDQALSRSVESFSDSIRVLARRGASATADSEAAPAPAAPATPAAPAMKVVYRGSRKAAAEAARRRRRVLGVLLVALLATVGTSYFAVTPWISAAVPAILIVTFLVIARFSVKASRRVLVPAQPAGITVEETQADLGTEDTSGISREELAKAVAQPTTDAGGLWDPLPVTLPTYVNKARARRTVRTIELTGEGVTSSGHNADDSKLASQHDEKRVTAKQEEETPQKKVAGA